MKTKTYRFAVHSPHFLYPIYIKEEVAEKELFDDILEQVSKQAVVKWLEDFPHFFDSITAHEFYDSLSIMVSQEVKNVQPK